MTPWLSRAIACTPGGDHGDGEDPSLAAVLLELVVELRPQVAIARRTVALGRVAGRRGRLEEQLELVESLVERPLHELVERRAADRERERAPEQLFAVAAEHAAQLGFHRVAVRGTHVESFIGVASDGAYLRECPYHGLKGPLRCPCHRFAA